MGGFRQDAQASGAESDHNFQGGDGDGGKNRVSGHGAFLGAHGFGAVICGTRRHKGIIAVIAESAKGGGWSLVVGRWLTRGAWLAGISLVDRKGNQPLRTRRATKENRL